MQTHIIVDGLISFGLKSKLRGYAKGTWEYTVLLVIEICFIK
jgi:hypothetical protein